MPSIVSSLGTPRKPIVTTSTSWPRATTFRARLNEDVEPPAPSGGNS
jgi:hypothetical protein